MVQGKKERGRQHRCGLGAWPRSRPPWFPPERSGPSATILAEGIAEMVAKMQRSIMKKYREAFQQRRFSGRGRRAGLFSCGERARNSARGLEPAQISFISRRL